MHLLHIIPFYYPAIRYGGPINSVHGLAKGLVALGHEVRVLTTNIDGPGVSDVPVDRPVQLDGVEVRYLPVGRPRRITRAPAMRADLARLLPRTDVLHLHGVWQWSTWMAARAARRAGVPYLLSPRGMLVRELISRKSPFAKRLWLAAIERRTLAEAAAIHCTSELEAEDLRRLELDLAPVVVVPNGVVLPEPMPSSRLAEAAWPALPRGGRLLYLGRINWKKGIDRLIRALTAVPDALLRVVGPDEEGQRAALRALAREVGVADRVTFEETVHGGEKWALLAGADLLVLPSLHENWGMVVSEALGVGTPVVVTETVGAAELVRRHDAGAVVEGSPEALAAAIRTLLADPARRTAMGERARRVVRTQYSREVVARRMAELYSWVLGGGPPPASVQTD